MNTTAAKYERIRIVSTSGMGGAFNPPSHPEHTMSVETDLKRRPENRGSMSLSYALEVGYISPTDKDRIRAILTEWDQTKPAIGSKVFDEWITEVNAHWAGTKKERLAFIHEYYPEYVN